MRYFASTIVLHQARAGKLDGAAAMWQAMLAQAPGEVNLFLAVAAAACRTGANFVGPLISHALELARANDPRSALQLLRAIGDEAGRLNGAADSELVRALSAGAGQMLSIAVGSLRVAMSAAESEGGIAQLALECIACWATHGQLALATLGLCGSCETAHALAAIVLGASPQTLGSVAELLEPLTSSAQRGARAAAPGSAESADSWEASLAVLAPAVAARALETDSSTAPASHALARCAAALVRADRARVARGEIPGTPELVRALVHLAHAYDYLTAAMAIEAMAELLEVARAHEQAHMALMPALLARARMPPSASPGALSADELDDPPQLEYPEADDDGDDDESRSAPRASGQRNVFSERRLTHARAPANSEQAGALLESRLALGGEFDRFREQPLAEALTCCYVTLRSRYVGAVLQFAQQRLTWRRAEAAIFAVRCVSFDVVSRALLVRAKPAAVAAAARADRRAVDADAINAVKRDATETHERLAQLVSAAMAPSGDNHFSHVRVVAGTCRLLGALARWLTQGFDEASGPAPSLLDGAIAFLLRALDLAISSDLANPGASGTKPRESVRARALIWPLVRRGAAQSLLALARAARARHVGQWHVLRTRARRGEERPPCACLGAADRPRRVRVCVASGLGAIDCGGHGCGGSPRARPGHLPSARDTTPG